MDYSEGKIYKIVNDIDGDLYVGSTTKTLFERFQLHWRDCSQYPHTRLYQKMNNLGKYHFRIELLEEYPCENKRQLTAREEHYRVTLGATLNTVVCNSGCATLKEYRKMSYHRDREENIRKVKEWRDNNNERRVQTSREHYLKNRDEILTKHAIYRQNNKEKTKEWKSRKIVCQCGVKVGLAHKARHEKSEYHLSYIANIQRGT